MQCAPAKARGALYFRAWQATSIFPTGSTPYSTSARASSCWGRSPRCSRAQTRSITATLETAFGALSPPRGMIPCHRTRARRTRAARLQRSSNLSTRSAACCSRTALPSGTSSKNATSRDRLTRASKTSCPHTSSASPNARASRPSSATAPRRDVSTSAICSGRWGLPPTCCHRRAPPTPHGATSGSSSAGARRSHPSEKSWRQLMRCARRARRRRLQREFGRRSRR